MAHLAFALRLQRKLVALVCYLRSPSRYAQARNPAPSVGSRMSVAPRSSTIASASGGVKTSSRSPFMTSQRVPWASIPSRFAARTATASSTTAIPPSTLHHARTAASPLFLVAPPPNSALYLRKLKHNLKVFESDEFHPIQSDCIANGRIVSDTDHELRNDFAWHYALK